MHEYPLSSDLSSRDPTTRSGDSEQGVSIDAPAKMNHPQIGLESHLSDSTRKIVQFEQ